MAGGDRAGERGTVGEAADLETSYERWFWGWRLLSTQEREERGSGETGSAGVASGWRYRRGDVGKQPHLGVAVSCAADSQEERSKSSSSAPASPYSAFSLSLLWEIHQDPGCRDEVLFFF